MARIKFHFSLATLLALVVAISIGLAMYLAESKRKADAKAFADTIPDANPPTFACAQAESNGSLTIIQSLPDYGFAKDATCLLYTSPSPRDATLSRMPSSA